jgi:arsenate reductase-like glutaredoxin family protein
MGLDQRSLDEEELLALMVQEPRLLRRPLIVRDGKPYFFKAPNQLVPAEKSGT